MEIVNPIWLRELEACNGVLRKFKPGYKKKKEEIFIIPIVEENEIWKEWKYGFTISNLGNIKKDGKTFTGLVKYRNGRKDYTTYFNYNKRRYTLIRIIATLFVSNPNNFKYVHSKGSYKAVDLYWSCTTQCIPK